ncbi:MAG TPA: hypothetical protein VLJ42_07830 [Solirubrobacteraceae bacterium]|nr:hypothetical protein [Solirubrobacteraceae bacterium]
MAFLPSASDEIAGQLATVSDLSIGLMSATQGPYSTSQLLLDITQGARVSPSAYTPHQPPQLSLNSGRAPAAPAHVVAPAADITAGPAVEPWAALRKRADAAPQILQPGALAAAIPGGAGYAGIAGQNNADGALAASRDGSIAAVSLGPATTLRTRVAALRAHARLVVADLPPGSAGYADLRALSANRQAQELLLVVQRAPDEHGHELLWVAVGGLARGRTLSSQTTNQRGLIAAVDLAPTILRWLRLPIPAAMRGRQIDTNGAFDGAHLRALKARLPVISPRRLPALECLLAAWALLALCVRLTPWTERARARAWSLRVGALALLWVPAAVLVPASLQPSRAGEYLLLVLTCFALAALTDRFVPWPRAPLAPALTAVLAIVADALAGTQLLMRSLLGPNPIFGARFYGIGNELKSYLAVLVLSAVAAALYPAVRGRRAALTMLAAGAALAIVEGSARIGAGVGGVILVSAGAAVAAVLLLPGQLTRRRTLIVLLSPVLGLIALAALDLATAHGNGHFSGSVLHARSADDLRDLLARRYGAAYDELRNGLMPLATALALCGSAVALRLRARVLAPVNSDPAWAAALAGGLTAGVVGALSEDSGPVLLIVATLTLSYVLAYLWGKPPPLQSPTAAQAAATLVAHAP